MADSVASRVGDPTLPGGGCLALFPLRVTARVEVSVDRITSSLLAGLAGATALTAVHQLARRYVPNAPRMDVLGKRALNRLSSGQTAALPPEDLERITLAGDLVANSAFYALVGAGTARQAWPRGVALGLAAGAGALLLPERLGLGPAPHSQSGANQIMTVAWYLIGGLAAATALQALRSHSE